jgi:hypothetical protein
MQSVWCLYTNPLLTFDAYYDTFANLNGILNKFVPKFYLSVCASLQSLLDKGSVTWIPLVMLGNGSMSRSHCKEHTQKYRNCCKRVCGSVCPPIFTN